MKATDVIIVGAGAAGLEAARTLRAGGASVLVLEARERIGGRILTLHDSRIPIPIELGAEFIHGTAPVTQRLLEQSRLSSFDVATDHRAAAGGGLRRDEYWSSIERVLRRVDTRGPDESIEEFLARRPGGRSLAHDRRITRAFVEGFHAADPRWISAQSIAPGGEEDIQKESRGGRVTQGYGSLVDWLARGLEGSIQLGHGVRAVTWRPGRVTVEGRLPSGAAFRRMARRVLVTVPIGVLQARGAIAFHPEPPRLRRAIEGFAMGSAVRVNLWFRELPWDDGLPNFLSLSSGPFQALWTVYPVRWPLAVAWCGGPTARALCREPRREALRFLTAQLARSVGTTPRALKRMIRHVWWHNWDRDPYARGVYAYLRVGAKNRPRELARPEQDTLFMAGDATEAGGGTVEAALASGRRAARQIGRR